MLNGEAVSIGHWQISHKHGVYGFFIRQFATETRRKLDRVNFCKDFWDCYQGMGKNWPIAERRVISNDPRNNCRTLFGFSSLFVARVANSSAVDCSKRTSCFVHCCRELSCYALYCIYIQVSQLHVTCLDEKKRSTLFLSFGLPNTARVSDIVVS